MEVSARFHPNRLSRGATKTLRPYSGPNARFIESPPATRHHRLIPRSAVECILDILCDSSAARFRRRACSRLGRMVRQIAPVFFTLDIPRTLAYYTGKLGFELLGTWQDPTVYGMVARDGSAIHFRCAAPPTANPDKDREELLDAYLFVEDADALHAEYTARGVEFVRDLGNMPWGSREF